MSHHDRTKRYRVCAAAAVCFLAGGVVLGGDTPTAVTARGRLVSASKVTVSSVVQGAVRVLHVVPEGNAVREGDLLVELESADLEVAVRQRSIGVEQAEGGYIAAKAAFDGARAEAEARVDFAKQCLDVAEGALEAFSGENGEFETERKVLESERATATARTALLAKRLQRLEGMGAGDPDVVFQVEELGLMLTEVKSQSSAAEAKLRFLLEHGKRQRTAELKLAVAERQLGLLQARAKLAGARSGGEAALRMKELELTAAKHELERSKRMLEATRIHAPIDGTVIYERPPGRNAAAAVPLQAGATVRQGQPLLRVVDMRNLELSVQLPVAQMHRVRLGQRAVASIDAYPDLKVLGTVKLIGIAPTVSSRERSVPVTLALEELPPGARPGMTATATIEIRSAE